MKNILNDFSESALIHAIESNLLEVSRHWFGSWPQLEFHDTPDLIWGISDIPFPLFNPVLGAQLKTDTLHDAISEAVARCQARDVPMLWWIGPGTRPHDLGTHLKAHGFTHQNTDSGMAVDLNRLNEPPAMPKGLVVKQITDEETLKVWSRVCIDGFEMPDFSAEVTDSLLAAGFGPHSPVYLFLAWLDGEPIATALLFLGAGVAGIYNVATLPSARGRGVGTAITVYALQAARANGYRIGILHASRMGLNVYRKIGFLEYCKMHQYVWSG